MEILGINVISVYKNNRLLAINQGFAIINLKEYFYRHEKNLFTLLSDSIRFASGWRIFYSANK
jgi:hypothetical protein